MKIDLRNKTHYRDDHIREFVKRGIREERPDLCKRGAPAMIVYVVYTRARRHRSPEIAGYSSGEAFVRGKWIKVRVPKNVAPDRIDFAQTIAHELAHTRGMKDERTMRGSARYGRVGSWRTIYGYAETLPLEIKAPQQIAAAERILHAQFCRDKGCTHPIHQAMRPVPVAPMSRQEMAKLDATVGRYDRLEILLNT